MSIHIKENGESSVVLVQMQMRMKLMSAEYEKIDKENSALRLQLHELLDGRYLLRQITGHSCSAQENASPFLRAYFEYSFITDDLRITTTWPLQETAMPNSVINSRPKRLISSRFHLLSQRNNVIYLRFLLKK